MAFLHRRLEVFQVAVGFAVRARLRVRRLPRDWWWLGDQLARAAGSIVLNIAEGTAEWGTAQQRRYYRIARASTAECDAAICMLQEAGLIDSAFIQEADRDLNRISAMLQALIRRDPTGGTTNPAPRPRSRGP